MTGVDVSWSAPAWVGQSDKDYSDLIRKKAEAVTRRDKRAVTIHLSDEMAKMIEQRLKQWGPKSRGDVREHP